MRKILWIQNYQNFSNLESSFYGSLKICYLDSSYLSVDKSQFNNCNGKEDVNAGECIYGWSIANAAICIYKCFITKIYKSHASNGVRTKRAWIYSNIVAVMTWYCDAICF